MADEAAKILVIEDEPDMVRGLRDAMRFEGFDVCGASTGGEGLAVAAASPPDLVILDLMLPDINGFVVCERLRRSMPQLPIIMLTARSQEADKIRGLEAGADDYVTKPFSIGELLARIKAIFRRTERVQISSDSVLTIGAATVDLKKHTLTKDRRSHPLSFYEVELIKLLSNREGEPVTRNEILERIWGLAATSTNRTVDNFIVKLRRKIEHDPKQPKHILTVYGYGYKLVR